MMMGRRGSSIVWLSFLAACQAFLIVKPPTTRRSSSCCVRMAKKDISTQQDNDDDDDFDIDWSAISGGITADDDIDLTTDGLESLEDEEDEEEEVDGEGGDLKVVAEEDEEDEEDVDPDDIEFDDDEEEEEEEEEKFVPEVISNKRRRRRGKVGKPPKLDWNEEKDRVFYEMEDPADSDNPEYVAQQLKLAQEAAKATEQRKKDSFSIVEYMNSLTDEEKAKMDASAFIRVVEERAKDMLLTEEDFKDMDVEQELNNTRGDFNDVPYPDDPYQPNVFRHKTGLSDDDLREYDTAYRGLKDTLMNQQHWDKVTLIGESTSISDLSNQTIDEMNAAVYEIGGSSYNVTNWLIYDLSFNVTNLMLAAVKHNRNAPVLLQHWYPQLLTYERYQYVRDRDFDFTWDDVEAADLTELEEYYKGFGYDSIPLKAPAETGIIQFEELDEEEIKMAAFHSWVQDVYNPEADRLDLDDEDLRDEDNAFSEFYEEPQHPDIPDFETVEEEMEDWYEQTTGVADTPEVREYRDRLVRTKSYTPVDDPEFQAMFRGHLIVACSAVDADLEVAERITGRFEKEFGKAVFVETRVLSLARPEDNVFEIWLESYEIDLLHSKKKATSNTENWDGPAEVDDKQLDYLAERVRFLISDDSRYSYRLETEYPV